MELTYEQERIVIAGKIMTALDEFVLDFLKILEKYTDYVIVSGYVVVLFGRARGTEDVGIIIRYMEKDLFDSLHQELTGKGYYFLNPEGPEGLYEMLEEKLGIRIAEEDTIIPNIELKFLKDDFDKHSIEKRVEVIVGENRLFVSPPELQIPYKLYLGGDKDVEDAVYLWEILKEGIDKRVLSQFMEALHVRGEPFGIEV